MEEEKKEIIHIDFLDIYIKMRQIFKRYCDLHEDDYIMIPLWVIGTYFHKEFPSYPYLFFNAMKGSGKSRILKLIAHLAKHGNVLISITESVLFRTAHLRTLCIDEFEQVDNKEKKALGELLNGAYKKGGVVERAYKVRNKGAVQDTEQIRIERFDVYCPIVMANIKGMEAVLSDRCITSVLDKSDNQKITKLIEDFDNDPQIIELKRTFERFSVGSVCQLLSETYNISFSDLFQKWNRYISTDTTALLTLPTLTNTTDTKKDMSLDEIEFFDKIHETGVDSRHLELFFPLFLISKMCGCFDEMLKIAKKKVIEKKSEDIAESRDIALIDFLANRFPATEEWIPLMNILNEFKEGEEDWITPEWLSRALKRLNLTIEKRRVARGREVKIDFEKARAKIRMFRPEKKIEEERIIEEKKEEDISKAPPIDEEDDIQGK